MHLTHLVLRNFRNYAHAEVSFSPKVNLILGNNGQGKTNLLEAIYLISTGRSFRTRKLSELIRKGESQFTLEAEFYAQGVTQNLTITYAEQTRKVQHNHTVYSQFTSLLGILPGVLLAPEDHQLVSGSPAERRRFLDIHIAQIDPQYLHHLARYFRAMKQRNQLLKERSESTLSAWEEMMAHSGSYLIERRESAIHALRAPLIEWMDLLSLGKDKLAVTYDPSAAKLEGDPISHLKEQWFKARPREMQFGSTLIGPHRDDLQFHISDQDAKHYSSEGQKRCTAASLRIAEWQQFKEKLDSPPLMGIDDFGIQLDAERQKILQQQLGGLSQVFLTSPQALPLETSFHTIHVNRGTLSH
jgi:DNA replication and repair protein RecF